jgi:hypothetical protein
MRLGFEIIPGLLTLGEQTMLLEALGSPQTAGLRNTLCIPIVASLARAEHVLGLIRPYLGPGARPVRGIYFDKSSDKNWAVGWHQDLTIAVRERRAVDGFGAWSVKEGVPHVQPPVALLENILTLRLHLDDCSEENGALRVLPGTQRLGRLTPAQITEERARQPEVVCSIPAGGAMLMRPLLLHASAKSRSTARRRVLHVEYAGFDLPGGLQWCDQ